MTYDINTLDDLIAELDGPSKAAEVYYGSARPQGICNWKRRGFLPPSRHLQTLIELTRRGRTVNPELLDHTEEDWRVLGLMSSDTAA